MNTRIRTGSIIAALAVAVAVSGCSDKDEPGTGATTSGGSPSATATKDVSADDLLAFQPPSEVAGSSKAHFRPNLAATPSDLELSVVSVKATSTGTVLTYWVKDLSGDEGAMFVGRAVDWEVLPTLVDREGKKVYTVDTVGLAEGGAGTRQLCVCTRLSTAYAEPRQNTALYATLPDDVTQVEVRMRPFPAIKVPVTR